MKGNLERGKRKERVILQHEGASIATTSSQDVKIKMLANLFFHRGQMVFQTNITYYSGLITRSRPLKTQGMEKKLRTLYLRLLARLRTRSE